jgi:hypothetical protein
MTRAGRRNPRKMADLWEKHSRSGLPPGLPGPAEINEGFSRFFSPFFFARETDGL